MEDQSYHQKAEPDTVSQETQENTQVSLPSAGILSLVTRDDFFKSRYSFFRVECHVNCAYNDDLGVRGRNKYVTRHERMGIIGFSRVHKVDPC